MSVDVTKEQFLKHKFSVLFFNITYCNNDDELLSIQI